MAFRSLGSVVRGSMRARICSSSPGIAEQGAVRSAAWIGADALHGLRNAFLHFDGCKSPVAAAAVSAFAGARGLHGRAAAQTAQIVRARDGYSLPGIVVQGSLGSPAGRGACRFHVLRDVDVEHADVAFAALSVAVSSVLVGIFYVMKDTDEFDEARKEDTHMRTDPYLRSHQLLEEVRREMASYNKTIPDKKAVVQEYMEDDPAMRARFEQWMKEYGRTYQDEVEKARRFKIFKSDARFVDAANADAVKAGHSNRFVLNDFSDWNAEEWGRLQGIRWPMPRTRSKSKNPKIEKGHQAIRS